MQTHSASAPSCHDLAHMMQGRWLVTSRGALQNCVTCLASKLVRRHGSSVGSVSTPTPLKSRPTITKPVTEYEAQTGEPAMAHIVKTEPGEDAAGKVLEARIMALHSKHCVVMCGFHLAIQNNCRCAINVKISTRHIACLMTGSTKSLKSKSLPCSHFAI